MQSYKQMKKVVPGSNNDRYLYLALEFCYSCRLKFWYFFTVITIFKQRHNVLESTKIFAIIG